MSYLRAPPRDEEDFPTFALINTAFGFIPNFFRAQTMRTDLIDAEIGLIGAILVKEGALTRRQKEYIFLVCSAANLSTYWRDRALRNSAHPEDRGTRARTS